MSSLDAKNKQETMEWVRKFLVKARYGGHLGQTPILPDGQAMIDFPPLIEKDRKRISTKMGNVFPNQRQTKKRSCSSSGRRISNFLGRRGNAVSQ